MSKSLRIALAGLIALAAVVLWTMITRIPASIKSAIETEGALATQTQVLVGGVEFSPFSGAGALDGLTIGNPNGYAAPYAVVVDRITLRVASGSLFGSGPVIVESAAIIAPKITYKAQGPTAVSNLEAIKNQAQTYATSPAAIRAEGSARKMIIRDLTVMGGTLTLDLALPGGPITIPLPPLHLANVGAAGNGAMPPEIIRAVCEALADEAKKAVADAIAQKAGAVIDLLKPPGGLPQLPKLPKPPSLPPRPSLPAPPSLPPRPSLPSPPSPSSSSSSQTSSAPSFPSPPSLPSPPSGFPLPPPPPGFQR